MRNLTSRQKIMLGVYAMILAMAGDYLLGFGTFSTSSSPDAYMGMTFNVVPDWRYAVSSVLGFICAALFAVAAVELMHVMEEKYKLSEKKLYLLFKIANWGGILYFAFIHIGICMLPVVFNAGMAALICTPLIMLALGQLTNFIMEGLDSGAESFGWLTLYLVCALSLVGKEEKV